MVTTFSGVGNLTKLRHLRHLTRLNKFKVVIGTVEVSAASASLMLRYSDNCGEKVFCQKLTTYLFWLEMMSLSADVITQQMLKKSAKEALAVADNTIDVRVKKELAKFANAGDGLLSSIKRKFSNKLNEVQWSKFETDFGSKIDVLKKFDDNPGLVDSWTALEGFANLRKMPANLEVLDKVKDRFAYNGKAGQEALEEIFTGHKSAQKFIDNLDKAEQLFKGVGIKHWSGIKSAGEVRLVNDAGVVIGKVDNGKFTVTVAKGSRPAPNTYLTQKYIDNHLTKFDEGASYLVPKGVLDEFGRNPVGRPDGQFTLPKSELDEILNKANGDLSIVEKELGIPQGLWNGQEMVRIDIPNAKGSNARLPNGNESGANELWIPGGKTFGGISEAVLDPIPQGNYTEILTNLK